MLRDKAGNRLFRRVTVRMEFPDNIFPPKTITQRAGPKQGFGSNGIDEILMGIADQLDTLYPYWDFQLVELAPDGRTARYFYKFVGYRSPKINPNAKSNALEPEMVLENTSTKVKSEVGTRLAVAPSQE